MKQLPENIQNKVDNSFAIITKAKKDKKVLLLGLILCFFIVVLLYLLSLETKSIRAQMEGAREIIYSPVEGYISELPMHAGQKIERGEALLRFEPSYIREQNSIIRDYLVYFQQNRQNVGFLKQKFRPLFSQIFDDFMVDHEEYLEAENKARKELKEASTALAKIKLDMRSPQNLGENGLPKQEFVDKEARASEDIKVLEQRLEEASLRRAESDDKIKKITADLNQPHGMLYRYLEEENARAQKLVRYEYLYARTNATFAQYFVNIGDFVQKDQELFELLPKNSGQWWVNAYFTNDDAENLSEGDICLVSTEDGLGFEARVMSISPFDTKPPVSTEGTKGQSTLSVDKDFQEGESHVRLFVQKAPEELDAYRSQAFNNNPNVTDVPIYVTVILK